MARRSLAAWPCSQYFAVQVLAPATRPILSSAPLSSGLTTHLAQPRIAHCHNLYADSCSSATDDKDMNRG